MSHCYALQEFKGVDFTGKPITTQRQQLDRKSNDDDNDKITMMVVIPSNKAFPKLTSFVAFIYRIAVFIVEYWIGEKVFS